MRREEDGEDERKIELKNQQSSGEEKEQHVAGSCRVTQWFYLG